VAARAIQARNERFEARPSNRAGLFRIRVADSAFPQALAATARPRSAGSRDSRPGAKRVAQSFRASQSSASVSGMALAKR
jgi:hypothetical protein